jgi:bifunctional DNase/RNase
MMADKFDRFTKRARRVLTLAQEEAHRLNHNYIGTEHLLLGLIHEDNGVAARVLRQLGANPRAVRERLEQVVGRGQRAMYGKLSLTPRVKRIIELGVDEARRLGHHYIGTEHLLLGLIREGEGVAIDTLKGFGISLEKVRSQLSQILLGADEVADRLPGLLQRIERPNSTQWLYRLASDEPPQLPLPAESPAASFEDEIVWTGDEPLGEIKLVAVYVDVAGQLTMLLKGEADQRYLRIWIESQDVQALDFLLLPRPESRTPNPNDFADNLVTTLGGSFVQAEIIGWRDQSFSADVVVERGDRRYRVAARPAEAVGIALRNNRPVYVTEPLLETLGLSPPE